MVRAQAGPMRQREVGLEQKVGIPKPYLLDQLNPIIDRVIAGDVVDWRDPNFHTQFPTAMNSLDKPIMRSVVTFGSYDPQSPQIIEAFQKLTDDLSNFTPDASLLGDPVESKHWTFKFHLNVALASSLASHLEIRQMGPTRELKRLMDQIEKQRKQMIKTLDSLTLDDLDRYLILSDGLYHAPPQLPTQEATAAINAIKRRLKKYGVAPALYAEKIGHATFDNYYAFTTDLSNADRKTWSRLSKKWRWEQVKSAVDSLRTVHRKVVLANVLATLEENLVVSHDLKAKLDPEAIGLVPNDFATLLRFMGNYDDYGKEWLEENYPALAIDRGKALALEGLSLPKHILPMAAVRILNRLDTSSSDRIKAFLSLVHVEISADPKISARWLAALLVLKKLNPDFEDFYNRLIDRFEALPETMRDIVLDRKPGSIWLGQDSKIRVNFSNQPQRGYLLHTSIAQAEVPVDISSHQSVVKPAQKREDQPQYKTLILPFIGHVNLLDEAGVSSYVNSLKAQTHGFPNEDDMLSEFEELQGRFKEHKNGFGTIIFFSKLNAKDQKHRNIRNLGLEGIVIRERSVDLITSGQPPFAMCARMDENGLLHISGTGDSFIGEPEHLLLNNLVLYLSSRPFSLINETRPETANELRDIVRNWNRFKSDNFPRITFTNPYGRTNIVITAGPTGNTETFLLNEAS